MIQPDLKIIPVSLLETYKDSFQEGNEARFNELQENELTTQNFNFYTSVSAVYSSKIEGEDIEMDSFIKHKRFGAHFQPDYTQKIDDLYNAYLFAGSEKLNSENLLKAHKLITRNILQPTQQGKLRTGNMYVITDDGRIEYVAATPDIVNAEMQKLYIDIKMLLATELTFTEVFYFASFLHLVFVKIHPFEDGNGRTARLLEKWFLAQKLGKKAWYLQSEKKYYNYHQKYYSDIRLLGLEYDGLDYNKALPFLQMLATSI